MHQAAACVDVCGVCGLLASLPRRQTTRLSAYSPMNIAQREAHWISVSSSMCLSPNIRNDGTQGSQWILRLQYPADDNPSPHHCVSLFFFLEFEHELSSLISLSSSSPRQPPPLMYSQSSRQKMTKHCPTYIEGSGQFNFASVSVQFHTNPNAKMVHHCST